YCSGNCLQAFYRLNPCVAPATHPPRPYSPSLVSRIIVPGANCEEIGAVIDPKSIFPFLLCRLITQHKLIGENGPRSVVNCLDLRRFSKKLRYIPAKPLHTARLVAGLGPYDPAVHKQINGKISGVIVAAR